MTQDNSEQVTYAAGQLRETLPDLDEAHPHAGLVQDDGKRDLINYLTSVHEGDISETEIYGDIVRNEATDSLTDAVNAGNVSEMQFAVGMVSHDESASDASTQAWLRNAILDEAYCGWVTGGMGSGKTDFALDRADDWHHATRGRVATNIQSAAEQNDPIEYIGDFEGVESFFKQSSTDVLYVLDETDQQLSGKGSDRQAADALANTLKLVRKGESAENTHRGILLIGQSIRGASKELRRLVTMNGHLYHKTSKTTVEIYGDVVSGELSSKTPTRTLTGVKPTRFGFDTGEETDFDVSGAVDADEGELLDGKEKDIKTAILAVEKQGMSYREAASLTDYGKDWVGDRYREWQNGEHVGVVGMSPNGNEMQTADD
ncbi:hypothetical protein [Halovenus salina]|uniref:Uncharacterized protein n=1 Tax=Halovenus salina TaxID=1510225 RepID=A0ABD5W230_9EURY|nr:hypothetical protein [Halovenus salina]